MSEKNPRRMRMAVVHAALILFGAAIAVRLFSIQLLEGDKWRAKAESVAVAMRDVRSERGHIFSDDDRLLATSVPVYEIRMDMRADGLTDELFNANIDSLSWCLAKLFGDRPMQEYRRSLVDAHARGERYHLLRRNCDHEQLQALRAMPLFRLGRNKSGFIADKHMVRIRPFGRLASRTVGYLLKDSTAIGLEAGFAPWLQGVSGKRLERRLTGGVWMPVDGGEGQDPIPGSDVHTTIDMNLQDVADAALAAQLRKNGAHHGCVVVMETQTGYIKAISNLTLQKDSSYTEDYNYAVGASTEPGSTFKTAALMVALEDGRASMDQVVDTRDGKVRFYDRVMRDSHEGGYGRITLQRALELSSNTGISQVIDKAYRTEPARFVEGLRRLGFGSPLGVRVPGEGMPVLRGPEDKKLWSGTSLPWMSIGYEVSETPLRMLTFYNAIANSGKMVQPQFVHAISRDGKITERFPPVVLNERICSQATLEKLRHALEGVVDSGTAVNLRSAHFRIAGKTGTAQIASDKAGYKVNGISYQASFVGYFPADAPRYTCIIVVSSPSMRGVYGNVVAGPVFREIADKIYSNRLEMQTQLAQADTVFRTPVSFGGNRADLLTVFDGLKIPVQVEGEGEWARTEASDSVVVVSPRAVAGQGAGIMPNVLGMGLRDALYILENQGLRVRLSGSGLVKKQWPAPGTRSMKGATVTLELAT
ncbi:MAG: transpeptidase family protein [Flavobacteriales bacterium]|nr:transpeptidase family protein [Flavobacteriales bacterium]MCL4280645.1 transpeptidase family protein [Flavobacteriales bacterium]